MCGVHATLRDQLDRLVHFSCRAFRFRVVSRYILSWYSWDGAFGDEFIYTSWKTGLYRFQDRVLVCYYHSTQFISWYINLWPTIGSLFQHQRFGHDDSVNTSVLQQCMGADLFWSMYSFPRPPAIVHLGLSACASASHSPSCVGQQKLSSTSSVDVCCITHLNVCPIHIKEPISTHLVRLVGCNKGHFTLNAAQIRLPEKKLPASWCHLKATGFFGSLMCSRLNCRCSAILQCKRGKKSKNMQKLTPSHSI